MFKTQLRITRHDKKAPALFTGGVIIGGNVTPGIEFSACVADDYQIFCNVGGAGNGVTPLPVGDGVHFPCKRAVICIEGVKVTVQGTNVDRAAPDRHTTIDHPTAGFAHKIRVNLRLEFPHFSSGTRVDRVNSAFRATGIHHAIDHDWGSFKTVLCVNFILPGKAQFGDIVPGNLFQRRMVGLLVIPATRKPGSGFNSNTGESFGVYPAGLL